MVFFFVPNLSNIVLVFHRILDLKARGWIYILAPFYCLNLTRHWEAPLRYEHFPI
jgi:hypothetical protein